MTRAGARAQFMAMGETRLRHRLATWLKRARGLWGWTQGQAASASGIALRHYQRLEGEEASATIDTVEKVADAFDVDPSVPLEKVGKPG